VRERENKRCRIQYRKRDVKYGKRDVEYGKRDGEYRAKERKGDEEYNVEKEM